MSYRIGTFHLNQVGDLLFSLPALKSLRAWSPQAHVAAIVKPSLIPLLECAGLVDEIIPRRIGTVTDFLHTRDLLRQRRLDRALLFSQAAPSSLLAWAAGIPDRVGFAGCNLPLTLTREAPKFGPPSVENNLRLIEAAGVPATCTSYVGLLLAPAAAAQTVAEKLQAAAMLDRPFVLFGPAASPRRAIKEWPGNRFADVARRLIGMDIGVVIVGATPVAELAAVPSPLLLDLTGQTSLVELLPLAQRAACFLGVDSGVMHVAAAMGCRCVALFGPTDPHLTGPMGDGHTWVRSGIDCSPCHAGACDFVECMKRISSDRVVGAVEAVLHEQLRQSPAQ